MENLLDEKDKDFIEEDPRSEVINNLSDLEEVHAAQELLEEKYAEPGKDTSAVEKEPDTSKDNTDTSDLNKDKTKTPEEIEAEKVAAEEAAKKLEAEKTFTLTDELIEKQPEQDREILKKYTGKGKSDLAKAAANAIALKSPYLKDNEEAIAAVAKKIEALPDDEILKTLIDNQKEIGKSPLGADTTEKQVVDKPVKIELPSLPDNDPKVQEILDKEVVKKLKAKYPSMPEDMNSVEFKEWERDLLDEGGLTKANQFLEDSKSAKSVIKTELQKVLYAQTQLPNLYNESPSEVLHLMTDENLPKLKNLNDNYRTENNKAATQEVEQIKAALGKYGISEKDLEVDLTLTPDANGSLFNKDLNALLYDTNGNIDPNIVGFIGKVPVLKKGQLVKKFIYEHNPQILTLLVANKSKQSQVEIEKLKSDALKTVGASNTTGNKNQDNGNGIINITSPEKLKKVQADLEAKYQ
jgi:hypothetical protein